MPDVSLTLTDEERDYLVRLLQHTLKERQIEEHRTKTPLFREHVIHEEQLLISILGKLGQPAG